MSQHALSKFFQRWVSRARRPAVRQAARDKTRLRLEEVEARVVPSSLPTAQVEDPRVIRAGFQPQVAQDPRNENNLVLVINNGTSLLAMTSTNAGQTWIAQFSNDATLAPPPPPPPPGVPPPPPNANTRVFRQTDPTIDFVNGPNRDVTKFTNTSSASVAFGRDGKVYITALEHNANKTDGVVVVYAFDFAGGGLNLIDLDPQDVLDFRGFSNSANVVYQWSGQDPALNPTIAVDNNLHTFTDPQTGIETIDTMVDPNSGATKGVYVAWNTDAASATLSASTPFNRNAILAVASSNGGLNFSHPVIVNDSGYGLPGLGAGATSPQILFTPSELNPGITAEGGQLTFVWSTTGGGVRTESSRPDGGFLSQPAVHASGPIPATFVDQNGMTVNTVSIREAIVPPPPPPNVTIPDTAGRRDLAMTVDLTANGNLLATDVLADLDVSMGIYHPNLNHMRIILTAPNGDWIDLLRNRTDGNGNTVGGTSNGGTPGITGVDLGLTVFSRPNTLRYHPTQTTFNDEAPRFINDGANGADLNYHVRPEGGFAGLPGAFPNTPNPNDLPAGAPIPLSGTHHTDLESLYSGLTAGQLSGTWVITIFDSRDDNRTNDPPAPLQFVDSITFHASAYISNDGFGTDRAVTGAATIPTAPDNVYPDRPAPTPVTGFGASYSAAYDTSLGSFSPFAGRMYVAYTTAVRDMTGLLDSNVFLRYSNDNGQSWSSAIRVSDDNANDNFSEGRRWQFNPTVTVDPTTGTVVVTWYDARNDASAARVATYIATSIDGGNTFSTRDEDGTYSNNEFPSNQTWLNETHTALDAVTGQTIDLEPIPSNFTLGQANGFGLRQALVAYGGEVLPFWTGNRNSAGTSIFTNTVRIAAGPRVVAGDMGPVTSGSTAADGTPLLNGFSITFDRLVDVATFGPQDVTVLFRSPDTALPAPGTLVPVVSVEAQDNGAVFGGSATRFFVRFATPQSAVGTYSYSVGTNVSDRIRARDAVPAQITPRPGAIATFSYAGPPVPILDNQTATAAITVPPPVNAGDVIHTVRVTLGEIRHTFDGDLRISLVAPDGTTVVLVDRRGGGGEDFLNTLLDDTAGQLIQNGFAPFTGTFQPDFPLVSFRGRQIAGNWTLRVEDLAGADEGQIVSWSLEILPGIPTGFVRGLGNNMDQDGDGTPGELTDAFANPRPLNGIPFSTPYDSLTLPLIIPGPHMVATSVPGEPFTSDNRVVNGVATQFNVTFDRDMNAATFRPGNVLRMTGPAGAITGPFTVTPVASTFNPATGGYRTFTIGFPPQVLSGSYSLELGLDPTAPANDNYIRSTSGHLVDTNLNAGLDVLRGGRLGVTPSTVQTRSYTVSGAVAIPVKGTAELALNITDEFIIEQILSAIPTDRRTIQLTLDASFPNVPDLVGELVAPDGTVIKLFVNPGTQGLPNQTGFAGTRFDDSATSPISTAAPPFNPSSDAFNPQEPFARFVGKSSKGQWTLRITNASEVFAGTLNGFTLTLPFAVTGTGLGEPVADRINAGFRVFTQDPTNPLTQQTWTPVGPASENSGGNSSRTTALAIDPSDPSGNTVYIGAASGGIWKTTNFLTLDSDGPQWMPLTDFGPTFSLNIGGLAVFPRGGDTTRSIIVAATGEGDTASRGVGFLISRDGGATWQVFDSTTNVDGNGVVLPINSSDRDRTFVGSTAFKVAIDPTPLPNGEIIIYAALSGRNGGVWRSNDTGGHWTLIKSGQATDLVLSAGSAPSLVNPQNPSRQLERLYAAFRGEGVFQTVQATTAAQIGGIPAMTLLAGNGGNPLYRDGDVLGFPQIPIANSLSPNGAKGRISLAAPVLTSDPIQNLAYAGWLYAIVATAGGDFDGLYMTKDFGINWVKVDLSVFVPPAAPGFNSTDGFPTNDHSKQDHNVFGSDAFTQGNYDQAVAIDPNNPNVVYIGGIQSGQLQPAGGMIRVDVTRLEDSQAVVAYNYRLSGGATTLFDRTSGSAVTFPPNTPPHGGPGAAYGLTDPSFSVDDVNGFMNLFRDPFNPFNSDATLIFTNVQSLQNRGFGAFWQPFNAEVQTDVHRIITFVDPLTGKTRLITADDQGVASAVDDGNGAFKSSIGFAQGPSLIRNGNLQTVQFYYGAAQPSQLAADIAGAMFYGMAQDNGFPDSPGNVLQTGNIAGWTGPAGDGTGVATDQTGSGTVYEFRWPCCGGNNTGFFLVNGVARTQGLLQADDDPFNNVGQWQFVNGSNFAVNSIDPDGIIISANGNNQGSGRLFRTTNRGLVWSVIGETPQRAGAFGQPGQFGPSLDGTYAPALAFGAPMPGSQDRNSFIYVGTNGGRIFVSRTAGQGGWLNISMGLDGSGVRSITTNPRRGSTDAFAVTFNGVYYKADAFDTTTAWVDITGNLFSLQKAVLPHSGNPTDLSPTLGGLPFGTGYLEAIVADWRYEIPVNPQDPFSPTFPVLYVGGEGGVYRSEDALNGSTWNYFPAASTLVDPDTGATYEIPDGGYLPNAHVTDLDLSIGNIDPASGLPLQSQTGGLNMLVATTYGRGTFAIRLSTDLPPNSFVSGPQVIGVTNPDRGLGTVDELLVQFSGPVDPLTFGPEDVVLRNPAGQPVAVTGVTNISGTARNRYRISFTPQSGPSAVGRYTLIIGPTLSDLGGNLMNQDGDMTNGEPIEDQFATQLTLLGASTNDLSLTGLPPQVTAGTNQVVTVTVRDSDGNRNIAFNGTVTITSTDPQALVNGAAGPTWQIQVVDGQGVFTVQLRTAGQQSLTTTSYTGTGGAVGNGNASTTVNPAALSRLGLNPPLITGSAPLSVNYTVAAQDEFGNTVPGVNGDFLITTNASNATVPASVTLTNGVGSFAGEFRASGDWQVDVAGQGLTGSGRVVVSAGTASQLIISVLPGPFQVRLPVPVTIEALDANGNRADLTGPIVVATTDGSAVVSPNPPSFINGLATFTIAFNTPGSHTITATAAGVTVTSGQITISERVVPPATTGQFAVGSGMNGSPIVRVFNADGSSRAEFNPFPPGFAGEVDPLSVGFTGGNRVAVGDVTGDRVPDYIVASGPTITARVLVIDGANGRTVLDYIPFGPFLGGAFVSLGDVNADGINEIVITPDVSGGPRVTVLRGGDFAKIADFFGIDDPNFRGGARTGVGDINGDGFAEVAVSAGFSGGPRVSVYDGAALLEGRYVHPVSDFFAFEDTLRNGTYLAVGDFDGDGFGDIAIGAGPGGAPRVLTLSGRTLLTAGPVAAIANPVANFFAGNTENRGGVRVASKDLNGDRFADLVVGDGEGGGSSVTTYGGGDFGVLTAFDAFPGLLSGVFVG